MFRKLKYGDKNDDVVRLQKILNKKLFPPPHLEEDGEFGSNTFKAVKKFQQSVGLTSNGVVGPWTWIRLYFRRMPSSFSVRIPLPRRASGGVSPNAPSAPTKGISKSASESAPWMEIVKKERGTSQIEKEKHNPRIIEYHSTTTLKAKNDETAWCSSFVNWVMKEAGYNGTGNALAISWLNWGQKLEKPRYGAITVVYNPKHSPRSSGNHVAFFVSETKTHIYLMGGNQSKTVRLSGYPKNKFIIKGYCWPTKNNKTK